MSEYVSPGCVSSLNGKGKRRRRQARNVKVNIGADNLPYIKENVFKMNQSNRVNPKQR